MVLYLQLRVQELREQMVAIVKKGRYSKLASQENNIIKTKDNGEWRIKCFGELFIES